MLAERRVREADSAQPGSLVRLSLQQRGRATVAERTSVSLAVTHRRSLPQVHRAAGRSRGDRLMLVPAQMAQAPHAVFSGRPIAVSTRHQVHQLPCREWHKPRALKESPQKHPRLGAPRRALMLVLIPGDHVGMPQHWVPYAVLQDRLSLHHAIHQDAGLRASLLATVRGHNEQASRHRQAPGKAV